jgi:tripartite ATP-independent transporter DctM subunit
MADILLLAIVTLTIIGLILLGVEVAFAIGITSIGWLILGDYPLIVVASRTFGSLNVGVLLAIPFFILAGELMTESKITDRLVRIGNLTTGRFRGGLAQANVLTSMLFAGLSGAAVADVAALGKIFIPAMRDEGYDGPFSAALTSASSIIGPIIPPSIIIVLYGAITNTSIGALFAAAIIPGILLGLGMMVYIGIISRTRKLPRYEVSISRNEYPHLAFVSAVALTMPAIILIGILGGFFTPTEAAAVASAYAFLIGVGVFRTLDISGTVSAFSRALKLTAQLFIIIGLSGMLSWLLSREDVPELIANFLNGLNIGATEIMVVVVLMLLFVGTWLDISAAIIILAPTLTEVAIELGIPKIQFGLVIIVALTLGLITPPLGLCLFAAAGVSKLPVEAISKQMLPFYSVDAVIILLLIYIPELTLYVPRSLGLS